MAYSLIHSEVKDHPWLDSLRREVYKDLFDLTWGGWDEESCYINTIINYLIFSQSAE